MSSTDATVIDRHPKILCPVDFSASARAALETAMDLTKRLGGTLTLIHVVQPPATLGGRYGLVTPAATEAMSAEAGRELAAWQADVAGRGAGQVETVNVVGTPWERIVMAAREGGHDLVVVGTHGRTGIKHAVLGSVAERVVRHAPCTVMVVRGKVS